MAVATGFGQVGAIVVGGGLMLASEVYVGSNKTQCGQPLVSSRDPA